MRQIELQVRWVNLPDYHKLHTYSRQDFVCKTPKNNEWQANKIVWHTSQRSYCWVTLFVCTNACNCEIILWLLILIKQHDAQLDYFGRILATASSDSMIKLFEVTDNSQTFITDLMGYDVFFSTSTHYPCTKKKTEQRKTNMTRNKNARQ